MQDSVKVEVKSLLCLVFSRLTSSLSISSIVSIIGPT